MIRGFYVITLLFFLSSISVSAQNWAGGVDDEIVHFGFTFQYVSSDFKILKKPGWRNRYLDPETNQYITDSLYSISSSATPGFGIGFVSNFRLGNNADIRLTPGLVFADRVINYQYDPNSLLVNPGNAITLPGPASQRTVQSTVVDFPLGIKIKSDRRNNFRAYLICGAKYSMDIVSKKKLDDSGDPPLEKLVKNSKSFLSYEAGIGFDLYFEYFKLSPELKLSNSIGNVLRPEVHPYSAPLDKLFLHNIQFSLYFE